MNQAKIMTKVEISSCHPEVDPVSVISHGGSLASGHYVVYTKVGGRWYLNDDSKQVSLVSSPFEQNSIHRKTVDIIVIENN